MSSARHDDALTPADVDIKRFATAQARAALRGYILHRLEDDNGVVVFIVTKEALTCELRDLDTVEHWLDVIEGRAP